MRQTRGDRYTSWLGRAWLDLKPRRGTLFLINIGVWERLEDMLVGATLVLVLTALVFPDVTKSLLVARLRRTE
jgi:hypothetical protein